MAADTEENDIDAVGVPVGGFIGVNFDQDADLLTEEALSTTPLVLPAGWKKVGLITDDGGPQDGGDKDDDTEFFQEGYKLPGKRTRTVQVTLAEMNAVTDRIAFGKEPDANGVVVVDDDNTDTFQLIEVIKFKNGDELRRSGRGRVSAVEPGQMERGSVHRKDTTFEWIRDEEIGGFYRQWRKLAATSPSTPETPAGE